MFRHKTIQQLQKVIFEERRLVYLGSIPQDASKHDIEAFIDSQGFHDSVFYWWSLDSLQPASSEHDGKCAIEFASEGQAQDALRKLFNPVQTQSLSQMPPPVSVSPPLLLLKKNVSISPDVDQHRVVITPPKSHTAPTPQPCSTAPKVQPAPAFQPSSSANVVKAEPGSTATPSPPKQATDMDPVEIRKTLDNGDYPKVFMYSEGWGKADVRRAIMALDEDEGRWDRWVTGRDGVKRIRSEIHVLDPHNRGVIKTRILVFRNHNGRTQTKNIDSEEQPSFEADG
ncbi:hypothetical protein NW762_005686 [Fusarium torreyae]|uniref:RRM domain-containing protein n=1 Tax=Fusarium torreyae TaxID=1237075 RepID=A0A9W8VGC4_9HYPO|nr:hypothetical protein NW762_005686 [Fusarium torreyae]